VIDRIDVSNWRRLGFPEYELVSDMITVSLFSFSQPSRLPLQAANYLAQLEDEIPDESKRPALDAGEEETKRRKKKNMREEREREREKEREKREKKDAHLRP